MNKKKARALRRQIYGDNTRYPARAGQAVPAFTKARDLRRKYRLAKRGVR